MAYRDESEVEVPVIEAVRAGDRYAFSELVRRQGRWVRGVVFGVLGDRDCVDDVVQQVWTAVWQRISELREADRWRPWLYRMARNAAIDAGRDVTRRRAQARALAVELPARMPSQRAVAGAEGDELHREVVAAIQALPAIYREPFVMRHLNGWSYADIADVMSMPVDSIETRLVRARRFLRDALKDKVK